MTTRLYPTPIKEIAFDSNPFDANPRYVDCSPFFHSAAIDRGKEKLLDKPKPGTEVFILNNPDGRFGPTNVNSVHYPHLKPRRKTRTKAIRWTGGGTAPAYRSNTTAAVNGTSIVVTKPAGVVDGDVLICAINLPTTITPTPPAGWIKLAPYRAGITASDWQLHVWYKVATSEGANYTWTFSATAQGPVVISAYSGAGGFIAEYRGRVQAQANSAIIGPNIETPVDNCRLIGVFGNLDGTVASFTPPAGMTERVDTVNTGRGIAVADETFVIGGVAGVRTATQSASLKGVGYVIALAPSGSGTLHYRYTGYTGNFPPQWRGRRSQVTVRATDGSKLWAKQSLKNPYVMENKKHSPRMYLRLNESTGATVAADESGNGRNGAYFGSPTMGQPDPITDGVDGAMLLDGIDDYIAATGLHNEFGLSTDWTFLMWVKTNTAGRLPLMDSDGANTIQIGGASSEFDGKVWHYFSFGGRVASSVVVNDNGWHLVGVSLYNSNFGSEIFVDGVDRTSSAVAPTFGSSQPDHFYIGRGSVRRPTDSLLTHYTGALDEPILIPFRLTAAQHLAIYQARNAWLGQTTGQRVAAILDAFGWPASDREIDVGQSTLQSIPVPGFALEELLEAANSEYGNFYVKTNGYARFRERHAILKPPYTTVQATFGDGPGEIPYVDVTPDNDELNIRNSVRIQRRNGIEALAEDPASIGEYGFSDYSKTIEVQNDNEAISAAEWYLALGKDSEAEIQEIEIDPANDPATIFPAILPRELEELIRILRRPPGESTIDLEAHIQGIKEQIGPGQKWKVTLRLSSRDAQDYALWDTGTWDSSRWVY